MPAKLPEALRHIELAGQRVDYALRRSRRRSIGLSIDHRGLRVGAPLRARDSEIEALLRQHAHWVLDKLASWREKPPAVPLDIVDGLTLDLFGQSVVLRLHTARRASWQCADGELRLAVPPARAPAQVLEAALRALARDDFRQRLDHHAPRLDAAPPALRLSSARTRWGSCNARGDIALNWRLIFFPPAVIDYVVCHELAHLREMNHSPRFWSVVEQLCPDWRAQRQALRRLGRTLPQFS